MAKVNLNRRGIGQQLKSPETARLLRERAGRVAARARSTAPVDSGEYRDEIEVVMEDHGDRLVARVYAESDHSVFVEAKHRTLGKALAAET